MSDVLNMHMLEMMASKICHDLISPIGAVNNGLEVLEELGPEGANEVMELIAYSAQQASAKLKAFRLAYGAGGSDTHLGAEDAYQVIQSIIEPEKKIIQKWSPQETLSPDEEKPRGFCKVLTALLLLAIEALPKGGVIEVSGASGLEYTISASGSNAGLRASCEKALVLKTPTDTLEPQSVHAALCGLISQHYGFEVKSEKTAEDCMRFYISYTLAA